MNNKNYLVLIRVISVVVPLLVAFLLFFPAKLNLGNWVYHIPAFNALLNTATSILLIAAIIAIKNKNVKWHQALMTSGFSLGAIFLLAYVLYHSSATTTIFGDVNGDGMLSDAERSLVSISRPFYVGILISHIALSVIVIPLVLTSFFYSLNARIEEHKKIVKFTFPIWLYVSITGVIVYLMVSPYYMHG